MSNKKGDLITPNTVLAVLFIVLTIVVISILSQWWRAYNSRGVLPAERSIDLLQRNINLMSENDKNQRIVPIQTNLYSIRTVAECNEEVTDTEGKPKTAYCICICTEDSSESCVNSQDNKEKYCRLTIYKTDINLEKIEQVKNYVLDIAGSGEDAVVTVKQYG